MLNPDKTYKVAMWAVSLVFASFLTGLGSLVIRDLPQLASKPSLSAIGKAQVDPELVAKLQKLKTQISSLQSEADAARLSETEVATLFQQEQEAHQNWLKTRLVTSSSPDAAKQDKELIERGQKLDQLQAKRQAAAQRLLEAQKALQQAQSAYAQEISRRANDPEVQKARETQELKNFLLRLTLTLPLLLASAWMIARKTKSAYWPLFRGFVLFSAVAFFFELVPYLPSYGGYVRAAVGVVICLFGGHFAIKHMQAYLVRRSEEAKKNEAERRQSLNKDLAVAKLTSGLCPGCERPVAKPLGSEHVNYCVHCGLKLFEKCQALVSAPAHTADKDQEAAPAKEATLVAAPRCGARRNAFYSFCPVCGSSSGAGQ